MTSSILLGKSGAADAKSVDVVLQARYGNRHGMIAGATGTGKSVSLMVMAEGFSRLGVPVLYARSGLDLVDGGEEAGRKAYADYTANRYHKPADEFDPDWDFRGVIEDLSAFYAVGRKLADETTFPQWKPDADFHRPAEKTPAAK